MSDNRGPNYMPTPERIREMCRLIRCTKNFRDRLRKESSMDYGIPVKMLGVSDDLTDNRMFNLNPPNNWDN